MSDQPDPHHWTEIFPGLARAYPKWLVDHPGCYIEGTGTGIDPFRPNAPAPPTAQAVAPIAPAAAPVAPRVPSFTDPIGPTGWVMPPRPFAARPQIPTAGNAIPAGPNITIPTGSYIDKHGKLRKKNPSRKDRSEHGLHQVLLRKDELELIRPSARTDPPKVFQKNPNRATATFWISYRQVEEVNEYRAGLGRRLAVLSKKKLADPEYNMDRENSSRRYEAIEHLKQQGRSFRTKDARFSLSS